MANEYVTRAELKQAVNVASDDTTRDTLLDYALEAASRDIDAFTNRRFYADGSASARTYRAQGRIVRDLDGELLLVDDISTTTGLVVEFGTANGSDWSATTDYEGSPENAIARSRPITGLRLLSGRWVCGDPRGRVRVTARWGWPAVPAQVKQATLLQASRLFKRKDSPEGVLGSAEFGLIRVSRMDPDVKALVRHFVIPAFA